MSSELSKVDAVAFDCDGVLVDARKSYDETIRTVVEAMVKELTGTSLPLGKSSPGLIAILRRTGGFNSDWDTTYALTLFGYVALKGGERLGTPLDRVESLAARFGSKPRKGGARDVDAFLDEDFPSMADSLKSASDYLGYPGSPTESRMAVLFDELYFGASLYQKSRRVPSRGPKKGAIELERLLVEAKTLSSLEKMVGRGRLALITGRPSLGTAYSLGKAVMSRFNLGASMFIGDADLDPALRAEYDKFRKPSPNALVRASEKLGSKMLLYVGDSAEDLMMVKDAKAQGLLQNCLFAGVFGMSPDPQEQTTFFELNGADIVVRSVNQIPARLLMARKKEGRQAK